jgi:hypothetical protein
MDSKPEDRDFVNYWRARLPKLPGLRRWVRHGDNELTAYIFPVSEKYPLCSVQAKYNIVNGTYTVFTLTLISKSLISESHPFTDFDSAVTYARLMYA